MDSPEPQRRRVEEDAQSAYPDTPQVQNLRRRCGFHVGGPRGDHS